MSTKMKKKTLYIIAGILACISSTSVQGQDIHFSQFYQTTILNNPGLVGVFNEDYKVGAIYRTQWNTIATPFQTELIDLETKVLVNDVNDYISFGLLGYSDKAGAISFQTTGFYPAINYNKSMEDKYNSYLSVGLTGGYISRTIDPSKMTFDNQYLNGNYSSSNPTGEQITSSKVSYWDLGVGVTWNSSFDEDNKVNYFLGAAAYHVSFPKTSFLGDNSINLKMRYDANLGLNYDLDGTYNLMFYANVMLQSPYHEYIGGAMLKYILPSNSNTPPFSLAAGVFYRYQDSWIPTVKLNYKKTAITFSYDINTSSLKNLTNSFGGFEISLFTSGMWGGYDDKHLCPRF